MELLPPTSPKIHFFKNSFGRFGSWGPSPLGAQVGGENGKENRAVLFIRAPFPHKGKSPGGKEEGGAYWDVLVGLNNLRRTDYPFFRKGGAVLEKPTFA